MELAEMLLGCSEDAAESVGVAEGPVRNRYTAETREVAETQTREVAETQ